jgi:hypothetical protein
VPLPDGYAVYTLGAILAKTTITPISYSQLPMPGADLEGGTFVGVITHAGQHVAVVLLPAKPETDLTWAKAKAWAQTVGGELPTRPVAAMLFAEAKGHFEKRWHWTADEQSASYAWGCISDDGTQGNCRKSAEGAVRAVRLIPLTA